MSATEVTLSGSFKGASSVPEEVGFYWGTSSNDMSEHIVASAATSTDGTFTASISGLEPGRNYVAIAYVIVRGTGAYASQTNMVFAPLALTFSTTVAEPPAVDKNWLELPSGREGERYITRTYYAGERNYTHLYDTQMKGSLWTAYPLNSSHMGSLSRPGSWSFSPDIPKDYQVDVTGSSYASSGYSRGHLLPNGSRNGNRTMQLQAFYVTNQVPQLQNQFNGSIWNSLENAVQSVAMSEEIYVVTGVAYQKVGGNESVKYLSDKKCYVPNYFYKLVLRVKYNGSQVVDAITTAFWMEHKNYEKGDTYTNYTVSVDQVEEWTGFDFFVNLPENLEEAAESRNTSWDSFKSFR